MASRHNWSGWPGAWCLSCGCDDPFEIGLADGKIWFVEDLTDPDGMKRVIDPDYENELATLMVCPEPGSNRHNPYMKHKD